MSHYQLPHSKFMPKKPLPSKYTTKASDRRAAAGKRPDRFLHSARPAVNVPKQDEKWNPKHFRLFVGNLGPDATDELLVAAFGKYASMSKARVVKDHKGENRGYGFVAFENADDYLQAFKEMNGKYVGQRPVQLKRAQSKAK